MHAGVVGSFPAQFVGGVTSLSFFSTRQKDKDHVHASFDQVRIEGEGFVEGGMLDRFIDVLVRHRLINKLGQTSAATQVFFVSFSVGGFLLLEPILLVRSQL